MDIPETPLEGDIDLNKLTAIVTSLANTVQTQAQAPNVQITNLTSLVGSLKTQIARMPPPETPTILIENKTDDKLDSLLAQLKIKFLVNRDQYPSEPERIAYTIGGLGDNALKQVIPF